MNQSSFLWEELPVNPSVSQDSERDWHDPRGNLMLTFGAIARQVSPRLGWFGKTSPASCHLTDGRDFGTFLGMLAELGYGFAYRVLDAQYFGVAQRRRRVFVVANASRLATCRSGSF
jgi:site-specific DNA-cytosine methylase